MSTNPSSTESFSAERRCEMNDAASVYDRQLGAAPTANACTSVQKDSRFTAELMREQMQHPQVLHQN